MTRERFEQILFAHVSDEVVQDMLNQYVLELESSNAKLRELVKEMRVCLEDECKRCHEWGDICDLEQCMRELGVVCE